MSHSVQDNRLGPCCGSRRRGPSLFAVALITVWLVELSGFCPCHAVAAADAWQVVLPMPQSVRHQAGPLQSDDESRFQRFRFDAVRGFETIQLRLPQQSALAIEDFTATVAVNSTQPGARLALQMVLPKQKDPRTGRPLTTLVFGDGYDSPEAWQTLTVRVSPALLEAKVRELRAEINLPDIEMSEAYFEGCILQAELQQGITFLDVGESAYGPIVASPTTGAAPGTVDESDPQRAELRSRVRIERNRVLVEGEPVVPRFIPDHGESIEFFETLGVNGVWVPHLDLAERMQELIDRRMVVMATPPHPEFDPSDFSNPLQGLSPLEQTFPLPDIWYLGTAIRSNQLPHLLAWAREVRSADRRLRRPCMADVMTAEGVASRKVDFVGISQNSVGSLTSFGEARNRSFLRQNASAQLTLPWEWVQTEHATEYSDWRRKVGAEPAFVEPEQILMQVVACFSAGCRGVGFWKTRQLDFTSAHDLETSKAIELANVYLQILEPLLVRGHVEGHIPIQIPDSKPDRAAGSASWLTSAVGAGVGRTFEYTTPPQEPDAAVISSAGVSLIVGGFWDTASQFVPQDMFARRVSLTVAATETASAWQVTATNVAGLRRQPTAGGLRLDVDNADQLVIVFVSSDHQERKLLEARVQKSAARAARLFVDLASLKLARVRETCRRIDELTGVDSIALRKLEAAETLTDRAQTALARNDFPMVEQQAKAAMRELRSVQNRYWYRAVQSLPTPAASPHTISFSTLYDHGVLQEKVARSRESEDLLPSGTFEHSRLLSDGTWKPIVTQDELYHASAEIVSESSGRNQVLRMRVWRRSGLANTPEAQPALLVQCPDLPVRRGDVLEISGRVKFGQGIQTTQAAPFLVFDSDLGPELAVNPSLEPSWRTFRILRQASESGPFRVWLALKGSAEVYVDDFSVVRRASLPDGESLPPLGRLPVEPVQAVGGRSRVQGAGYSNPSFP